MSLPDWPIILPITIILGAITGLACGLAVGWLCTDVAAMILENL